MKKVLLVEDSHEIQQGYKESLEGKVEVLQAYTVEQALEILEREWENIDIVSLDFYLDDADFNKNTIELTQMIRSSFVTIIAIAASWHHESRETQMKLLKCQYESPKEELPELILELIND